MQYEINGGSIEAALAFMSGGWGLDWGGGEVIDKEDCVLAIGGIKVSDFTEVPSGEDDFYLLTAWLEFTDSSGQEWAFECDQVEGLELDEYNLRFNVDQGLVSRFTNEYMRRMADEGGTITVNFGDESLVMQPTNLDDAIELFGEEEAREKISAINSVLERKNGGRMH